MKLVAEGALKQTMGSGTRRLFVKTWLQVLSDAREKGMKPLNDQGVEAIIEGATNDLKTAEEQRLVTSGE